MMKIISICGSRRKKGNTAEILQAIEQEIKNADIGKIKLKKHVISDLQIGPCKACLKCIKKGACVLDDDFKKIAKQMLDSDLIIVGSPVYFSDVSSPIKAFIDRTVSLWHEKQLKGKNVIFAAACAEYGSDHTIASLQLWARDHEMNVISAIEGKGENMGDILKDQKALDGVKNSVELLKKNQHPES
jgi:multimeric flavodoxin WrbA